MPEAASGGVRPARAGDIAAMAYLHARAFAPQQAWDAAALLRLAQTPGAVALVMPAGGMTQAGDVTQAAGLAGFVLMRAAAGEAEILTLAVDPQHRRQGVGRALVDAGLAAALAVPCAQVFLEVADTNTAAKRLYASLGFAAVGRRVAYYADGPGAPADALVLRWHAGSV